MSYLGVAYTAGHSITALFCSWLQLQFGQLLVGCRWVDEYPQMGIMSAAGDVVRSAAAALGQLPSGCDCLAGLPAQHWRLASRAGHH